MEKFRISLAGDLGSGKSTVTEILLKRIPLTKVSVGKLFREVAEEHGMTPVEFNVFIQDHPEYDKAFDEKLASYDKVEGNFIFDSRMAFHFVPSAISFYLKVDLLESAKRITDEGRRDESYSSIEEAIQKITQRRQSEILRYKQFYGVDITDMNNYDCVVDTTGLTPEQVADEIVRLYKEKTNQN